MATIRSDSGPAPAWCRRLAAAALSAGLALGAAPAWAAAADGTPDDAAPVAPDVRVGDLSSFVQQSGLEASATTRNWTLTPSIGVQETLTDNARNTAHGRRADLITSVQPSLLLDVDTERATGTLRYSPRLEVYAFEPHQNNTAQDFDGSLLATLVPDTLFLEAHAFATQQTTGGGLSPNGAATLNRADRTQTTSLSLSPYASHRFGGDGTGTLGYSLQYTDQTGNTAFAPGASDPFFVSSDTVTHEEFAEFQSGENLGRVSDDIRVQATQYSGQGVLDGAEQQSIRNEVDYALNRHVFLLSSIGWENQRYGGLPPVHIDGATWSGGVRFTPNADSSVTLRYVHANGFDSPEVDAVYAVTARTRLTASYSETLGTDQTALQGSLSDSTTDSFGNPVSRTTGAPLLLANQQFGLQNSLQRTKQFSVTSTTTLNRNAFTFSFIGRDQSVQATGVGEAAFPQRGWSLNAVWTHEFTPATTGSAYLQYGTTNSQVLGQGASDNVTLDLSVSRRLARDLVVNAQYILSDRSNGVDDGSNGLDGGSGLQNSVILGLLKTF